MAHVILKDGRQVEVEVNGVSMDGRTGSILLAPDHGKIVERLQGSREVSVKRGSDGVWREIKASM